ncbi:hypothetical protein G3I15_10820, partial [Streptomyces sp. SID10244]|nr:hypothetical protein [Streptomyces sp. SID10244]
MFSDNDEPVDDEDSLSPAEAIRARESRDVTRIIATAVEKGWCRESLGEDTYRHDGLQWR